MQRDTLQKLCKSLIDSSFSLHSRVHKMKGDDLYVKRDDELGFGISGSKLRKYVSILPYLKKRGKKVALVGSFYSNHVLSLLQLLKQEGIAYQLFLEKPRSLKGNAFFLSLLIKEDEVIWIEDSSDFKVSEEFLQIPMGGCMKEALAGSLTLPLDILQNEEDLNLLFHHIFVDAGSGMSAIALLLGMSYMQKNVHIHVVLMAGKEKDFREKLRFFHAYLQEILEESFPLLLYQILFPITAKSFGSHNATIFQIIKKTAEKEGVFLDPLYTAKLLLTTQDALQKESLGGNVLWIHSGGALSLAGFQESYFT